MGASILRHILFSNGGDKGAGAAPAGRMFAGKLCAASIANSEISSFAVLRCDNGETEDGEEDE